MESSQACPLLAPPTSSTESLSPHFGNACSEPSPRSNGSLPVLAPAPDSSPVAGDPPELADLCPPEPLFPWDEALTLLGDDVADSAMQRVGGPLTDPFPVTYPMLGVAITGEESKTAAALSSSGGPALDVQDAATSKCLKPVLASGSKAPCLLGRTDSKAELGAGWYDCLQLDQPLNGPTNCRQGTGDGDAAAHGSTDAIGACSYLDQEWMGHAATCAVTDEPVGLENGVPFPGPLLAGPGEEAQREGGHRRKAAGEFCAADGSVSGPGGALRRQSMPSEPHSQHQPVFIPLVDPEPIAEPVPSHPHSKLFPTPFGEYQPWLMDKRMLYPGHPPPSSLAAGVNFPGPGLGLGSLAGAYDTYSASLFPPHTDGVGSCSLPMIPSGMGSASTLYAADLKLPSIELPRCSGTKRSRTDSGAHHAMKWRHSWGDSPMARPMLTSSCAPSLNSSAPTVALQRAGVLGGKEGAADLLVASSASAVGPGLLLSGDALKCQVLETPRGLPPRTHSSSLLAAAPAASDAALSGSAAGATTSQTPPQSTLDVGHSIAGAGALAGHQVSAQFPWEGGGAGERPTVEELAQVLDLLQRKVVKLRTLLPALCKDDGLGRCTDQRDAAAMAVAALVQHLAATAVSFLPVHLRTHLLVPVMKEKGDADNATALKCSDLDMLCVDRGQSVEAGVSCKASSALRKTMPCEEVVRKFPGEFRVPRNQGAASPGGQRCSRVDGLEPGPRCRGMRSRVPSQMSRSDPLPDVAETQQQAQEEKVEEGHPQVKVEQEPVLGPLDRDMEIETGDRSGLTKSKLLDCKPLAGQIVSCEASRQFLPPADSLCSLEGNETPKPRLETPPSPVQVSQVGQSQGPDAEGLVLVEMDAEELLAEYSCFCPLCDRGFKREANLKIHMRGHGNEFKYSPGTEEGEKKIARSSKRYSCPVKNCRRNKHHAEFQPLKTLVCMKNHYKRTHGPKTLECSKCHSKSFAVLADLKTHEKHCGEESRWICSCGNSFTRRDKLARHMELFCGHFQVALDCS